MTDLVKVKHEGIEGTAMVPETALKHMDGWEVVTDDDTSATSDESEGAAAYDGWSKKMLEAEVASRNADRADDQKIQVAAPGNVPDLVAALVADDNAQE